jgi:hypothetical protein
MKAITLVARKLMLAIYGRPVEPTAEEKEKEQKEYERVLSIL